MDNALHAALTQARCALYRLHPKKKNGAGASELARSGGWFSNGQGPDEYAQDDCEVLPRNGHVSLG